MCDLPLIFSPEVEELPTIPCNVYDVSQLRNKINETSNQFPILVLNIRSLRCNFAQLETFLGSIGFRFSMIILTEVWLTSEVDVGLNISGYISESLYRTNHGGGLKM